MIEVRIVSIVILGIACFNFGFALCNFLWHLVEYRESLSKQKRQDRCDKR